MSAPRNTIRLHEPRVRGNTVEFTWEVAGVGDFYRAPRFELTFPESVDASSVPEGLWLRVMMICLHTHWALLRPCRVELPRRLPEGEREFWLRMIDAAVWTLENDRDTPDGPSYAARTRREVELVDGALPAGPLEPARDEGLVAACFSGGRDSLTQLGLLCELGLDPLLVTTISKRDASIEFETRRFHHVLEEAQRRTGCELVAVRSDIRGCFENGHPLAARYGLAVSELTDTLLYFAAGWATAWARGAGDVFLASEAEAQESIRRDGVVVQVEHFAYSAATQLALGRLTAPTGIGYNGLIASLEHFQIHRVLADRYSELLPLRYSCYHQAEGEDVCSRCYTCFKSSVTMIADGLAPSELGIDADSALAANVGWEPSGGAGGEINSSVGRLYCERLDADVLRTLRKIDPDEAVQAGFVGERGRSALATLRANALALDEPPPEPGFRSGYLDLLDEPVRSGLEAILLEHFESAPAADYEQMLSNTRLVSDWISAPLTAA